jgi:hypothetical protein
MFRPYGLFCSYLFHPVSANHAGHADDDERDAENLSHIQRHARFECHLNVFGVFDEEAEGEYQREAEAEKEACADLFGVLAVEIPADEKEHRIRDCFVQLTRMARAVVHLLEDERPRHVRNLADNLGVHQVAQSDEARRGRRGDGDIVQHGPQVDVRLAVIEPQGDHQSERSAVRGESLIAHEFPRTVGHVVHRDNHLDGVVPRCEEIVGLIEQAVAQSGTDEDAEKTVDEERVEILVFNLLFLVQPLHDDVSEHQSDEPAQRIPAHSERTQPECEQVRVPDNV